MFGAGAADPARPPRGYPGLVKVKVCRMLLDHNWPELADVFDIPRHECEGQRPADGPSLLWQLLANREKLHLLPEALDELGWRHIADVLRAAGAEPPGGPAIHPPPRQRDLLTLYFDLDPIRRALTAARRTDARLLVCAIPHADPVVGGKICDWLPICFDPIVCKPQRTLGTLLRSVDAHVEHLARFAADLKTANVGCHVDATRAPDEMISTFHVRVCDALAGIDHRLVLILTVRPAAVLPEGVVALPAPRLLREDVEIWAQRVLADRNLAPRLAPTWTDRIYEYAVDADEELDPRRTYEAMDEWIAHLLDDPQDFLRTLEQGSGRA